MRPERATLLSSLPKKEYDDLLMVCDVGMIFLDNRFTIPNFPSRLLSYLETKMPVIAATDKVSDVGDVLEDNNCGYKVISGQDKEMQNAINELSKMDKTFFQMKENAWILLNNVYKSTTLLPFFPSLFTQVFRFLPPVQPITQLLSTTFPPHH